MRPELFKALDPLCPSCRQGALSLREAVREDRHGVAEGLIECDAPACRHLYPVIDGIPLLVADLRTLIGEQILGIVARDDLSETILGVLGECAGPGSPFDARRQHLSSYAHAHWEDLAPAPATPRPAILDLADRGLSALGEGAPAAPVLDLGCSVGRTTAHLTGLDPEGPVIGADLSFAMLRVARRAVLGGEVAYARRRWGLVYEDRRFPVPAADPASVDFWCIDALALPLRPASVGTVLSLNLLDCLGDPAGHLRGIAEVLRPGGGAVLATPYDWSPAATRPEGWLGGHSPHGSDGGAPDAVLRSLLDGSRPDGPADLRVVAEWDDLAWPLQLHERSTITYAVHLLALRRAEV